MHNICWIYLCEYAWIYLYILCTGTHTYIVFLHFCIYNYSRVAISAKIMPATSTLHMSSCCPCSFQLQNPNFYDLSGLFQPKGFCDSVMCKMYASSSHSNLQHSFFQQCFGHCESRGRRASQSFASIQEMLRTQDRADLGGSMLRPQ